MGFNFRCWSVKIVWWKLENFFEFVINRHLLILLWSWKHLKDIYIFKTCLNGLVFAYFEDFCEVCVFSRFRCFSICKDEYLFVQAVKFSKTREIGTNFAKVLYCVRKSIDQ